MDNILQGIIEGKILGGGSSGVDYSTEEQDTGLKWIDGRTIFRKTIDFGYLPNNSYKDVDTGIIGGDFVVDFIATAHNNNGYSSTLPYCEVSQRTDLLTKNNIAIVSVNTSGNRSSEYAYITLFYVKTT